MEKKYRIIGFAGRARSGKSTLAKVLKEEQNAVVITIASYLKGLCCDILDVTPKELDEMKVNGTEIELKADAIEKIAQETNINNSMIANVLSSCPIHNVREMLQIIGTEVIRKYNPNWHINKMKDEIDSYPKDQLIVIDDVRFPNEREAIESYDNSIVLFIMNPRKIDNVSNHESERSLFWYNFDMKRVIINYTNSYKFIAEFLDMQANNFEDFTENRMKYEKYIGKSDNMYGVRYRDRKIFDYLLSVLPKCRIRYTVDGYPYVELSYVDDLSTFICIMNEINQDKEKFDGIVNPYIIENLKLYL